MNVIIDNTRQNEASRGIDRFVERCVGMSFCREYCLDVTIFNQKRSFLLFSFIDNGSSVYQRFHSVAFNVSICSCGS